MFLLLEDRKPDSFVWIHFDCCISPTGSVEYTGKSLIVSGIHKRSLLRPCGLITSGRRQFLLFHSDALRLQTSTGTPWAHSLHRMPMYTCSWMPDLFSSGVVHKAWLVIHSVRLTKLAVSSSKKKVWGENKWSIFTVQKRKTSKRFQKVLSWLRSQALESWLPKY